MDQLSFVICSLMGAICFRYRFINDFDLLEMLKP